MVKNNKNIGETVILPPSTIERFLPLDEPILQPLKKGGVRLAGLSHVKPGYQIFRPQLDFHVWLLTLEGKAHYSFDEQQGVMTSGQQHFFPAGHSNGFSPVGNSWKMIWFHFEPEQVPKGFPHAFSIKMASQKNALFLSLMEGLLTEFALKREKDILFLWSALLEKTIHRELLSADGVSHQQKDEEVLDALWQNAVSKLERHWTLEELASQTQWSKEYFAKRCLARYGESPIKRLSRLRLEKAQGLLMNSSLKVKEVAFQLGYQDEFAFSTAFTRQVGLSPAFWRGKRKKVAVLG